MIAVRGGGPVELHELHKSPANFRRWRGLGAEGERRGATEEVCAKDGCEREEKSLRRRCQVGECWMMVEGDEGTVDGVQRRVELIVEAKN